MAVCATEGLIAFWQRFTPEPGQLRVHADDRIWMGQHWPAPLAEPFLDWNSYTTSDRFGSRDRDVHLSHLPAPFWGDLRRAKAVICLKNPGFDHTDYYLESQPDFQESHLRTLRQECDGVEFPFIHLDPRFSWSGSFLWWELRLRPIVDELMRDGMMYIEALRLISQNIAALQLFPYRSLDSSRLRWKRGGSVIPSVVEARRWLAALTRQQEQLVLVMRSHADWHTPECADLSKNYLHGPRLQGVSLHPRFPAGKRLLERLRDA